MEVVQDGVNLTPLHDRVVVKRIEEKEASRAASSFRTPPKRSSRKAKSLPLAWQAREGELYPLDVKVGDRVLFGK